ncbi:FmdB family transcriptional regulator [Nocardioides sp.]|nr:FmdB family zinc ribbon protein [Nocardioides sp.]THI93038.1 FmdB family transcriptional regulator [Nocardioides sp.]
MPTYQYLCTDCGHAFERFQSFSEDALTTCPECTGRLRKVFNSVGVVFKGSGFYKTDSRSSSTSASPAETAASAASSPSPASSSSTESSSGSGTTSAAAASPAS